jgi:hypothetical protein
VSAPSTGTTGSAPTTAAPEPSALQPPSLPPNSGTGITGITLLAGGCPVERMEQPCRERPISVTLTVLEAGTNRIATNVISGKDGTFRVNLAAGRYLVRSAAAVGPLMSRAVPAAVEVKDGTYTPLTMRFQAHIQ